MKLGYTRAMVRAALAGELDAVPTVTDPVFGLAVPQAVRGVPSEVMDPRGTWADPAAYDAQARKLAGNVPRRTSSSSAHAVRRRQQRGPKG